MVATFNPDPAIASKSHRIIRQNQILAKRSLSSVESLYVKCSSKNFLVFYKARMWHDHYRDIAYIGRHSVNKSR